METPEELILRLAAERGEGKSISPEDVARLLGGKWQSHLTAVRQAAIRLAREGRVEILRKGKKVENLDEVRGVIRVRLSP